MNNQTIFRNKQLKDQYAINKYKSMQEELERGFLAIHAEDINNETQRLIDAAKGNNQSISKDEVYAEAVKNIKAQFKTEHENILGLSETVAKLDHEGIFNTTTFSNNLKILRGKSKYKQKAKYEALDIDKLAPLNQGFYGYLQDVINGGTPKVQSGEELIANVIRQDQMYYQFSQTRALTDINTLKKAKQHFDNAQYFMAFDFETLGGVNGHGYKTLDAITEYSFQIYDKSNADKAIHEMTGVIGVDKNQYDYYKSIIDKIESHGGLYSDEAAVVASRLSKYGHTGTKVEIVNGRKVVTSFAAEELINPYDTKAMRSGLDMLRDTYNWNQTNAQNGIMQWERDLASAAKMMDKSFAGETIGSHKITRDNLAIVSQNGIRADAPWFNQLIAKGKGFSPDGRMLLPQNSAGIPYLDMDSGRHLDLLAASQYASNVSGANSFYDVPNGAARKAIDNIISGRTSHFSQDAMGQIRFGDTYRGAGNAAHTAKFDVQTLARLVTQKGQLTDANGKVLFDFKNTILEDFFSSIDKAPAGMFGPGKEVSLANKVFVATRSAFRGQDGHNAMSFTHDAFTGAIRTFDGYEYDNNGVRKELFNQFGIKKDVAYSVKFAGKFDLNQKGTEALSEVYPEYAHGSLFGITLAPVINENSAAGINFAAQSPTTYIFNSEDEYKAFMTQNLDMVGEIGNDGKISVPDFLEDHVKNRYTKYTVDGKNVVKTADKNAAEILTDIVDQSSFKISNDAAGRLIREDSYKKTKAFYNAYDAIEEVLATGGIDFSTGNRKDIVKQHLREFVNGKDMILANNISRNKELTLKLQQKMGFQPYNAADEGWKLYRETFDRTIGAFDYFSSQKAVFNAIEKEIEATGEKNPARIQLMYEMAINNVKEHAARSAYSDTNLQRDLLINNGKHEVYAHQLNTFQFDVTDIIANKDSKEMIMRYTPGDERAVMSINLDSNGQYGLISDAKRLFNIKPTASSKVNPGTDELVALNKFVEAMQNSEQYRDIFKGLKANEYSSSRTLSAAIHQRIKDYRADNPTAGFVKSVDIQDAINSGKIFDNLIIEDTANPNNVDTVVGMTRKVFAEDLPKLHILSDKGQNGDYQREATNIVDKILFDVGDETKLHKQIDQFYGAGTKKAQAMKYEYEIIRKDQIKMMQEIMESTLQTNVDLLVDTEKKTINAMLNDRSITLGSLPTVQFANGMFMGQIGNNKFVVNTVLDLDPFAVKGNVQQHGAILRSNIGMAWNARYSPYRAMQNSVKDGRELSQLASIVANMSERIMTGDKVHGLTGSASVTKMNASEVLKTQGFDFSHLPKMLHWMDQNNMIDFSELRDPSFQKTFAKLLNGTSEQINFDDLSATQRETIIKNVPYLLRKIAATTQDKKLKFLLNNVAFSNNEKDLAKGIGIIGVDSPFALNMWNNQQRPVPTQATRQVMYRTGEVVSKLKANKMDKRVKINPIFENRLSRNLNTRELEGVADKAVTTLQTGKMNISELEFKKVVEEMNTNNIVGYRDFDSGWKKTIKEKLKSTNLVADEAIVDSRIADVFNKQEIQKISSRKQLIMNMENNEKMIEELKTLEEKVLPMLKMEKGPDGKFTLKQVDFKVKGGRKVNRYDHLFNVAGYGDNVKEYFSKNDQGLLKYGWYDKSGNMMLNSDEIVNAVKGMKFGSEAEAHKALDEMFQGYYYVDKLTTQSYFKVAFGGAEKAMANAPAMGIGTLNSNLKLAVLAAEKASGESVSMVGQIATDSGAEYLAKTLANSAEAAKLLGTSDEAKIMKMIKNERNAASTVLFDQLSKQAEANGFKVGVGVVTNQGNIGHGNAGYVIESYLAAIKENSGLDDKAFVKKLNEHNVFNFNNAKNAVRFENGKIILPNEIEGIGNYINIKGIEKLAKDIDPNNAIITDENGNELLTYGWKNSDGKYRASLSVTSISHIDDNNPGGTGSYYLDPEKQARLNKIKARMDEKSFKKLGPSSAEKKALIEQHDELEREFRARRAIDRGVKITEREKHILGLTELDQSFITTLQKGGIEDNEIEKLMGDKVARDANGKLVVSEAYRGKSALHDVVSQIDDTMKRGRDSETLADVLTNDKLKAQYKHLEKMANKAGADASTIGLKEANAMYSVSQGLKAMAFNNGEIDPGDMINHGFRTIGVSDLDLAKGTGGEIVSKLGNNIYNGNIIVDFGEMVDKEHRLLALPKLPERLAGDSIVKYQHQQMMSSVVAQYGKANEIWRDPTKGDFEKAKTELIKTIERTKDQLDKDVSNKDGLFSQLIATRFENSITGKASTIHPLSEEALSNKVLNNAQFMGESLAEHYKAGKYIDAKFMSEKAFGDLGYFDDKFMRQTLGKQAFDAKGNALSYEQLKDTMKQNLRTVGTAGIDIRYPSIAEGSPKIMMHYLDDTLDGARMRLISWSQKSAQGDNDGDNTASIMLRHGNRDYMEYALNRNENISGELSKFKSHDASMLHRAVGVNKVYKDIMEKDLNDNVSKALLEGDVRSVAADMSIDNKLFAAFGVAPSQEGIKKNSEDLLKFAETHNLDLNSENFYKDADVAISKMTDGAAREEAVNTVAFGLMFNKHEAMDIAKARKFSIGEANVPLYKLRVMRGLAEMGDIEGDATARSVLQAGAYEIEQEVISAKKGNVTGYVTKVQEFKSSLNALLGGDKKQMRDWIDENQESLQKKFVTQAKLLASENKGNFAEIIASHADEKVLNQKLFEEVREGFLEAAAGIGRGATGKLQEIVSFGTTQGGVGRMNVTHMLQNIVEDGNTTGMKRLHEMVKYGLLDTSNVIDRSEFKIQNAFLDGGNRHLIDGREWMQNEKTAGQTIEEAVKFTGETFSNMAKNINGKTLAIGALGLAGSFLVAGFVGGNPARPADTQAMEDSSEGFYDIPSLQDSSMIAMPSQKGYVVNINARTDKGRQHVQSVLNTAVRGGTSTDVNISMNINEQNGNIDSRYLEKLLAGAI